MILTINTEHVSYHHNCQAYVMRNLRVSCDSENQFFTRYLEKKPSFSKTTKILLQS